MIWESISVDVGSHGNPGRVEYKGVDTKSGEVIFEKEPIAMGTNNMGEFLAIVHGLAYLKKMNSRLSLFILIRKQQSAGSKRRKPIQR